MTMIDVVHQLQAQGHEVEYYVRKDGGILIRRIDNESYPTSSSDKRVSGNERAREMVGAQISEARISQLKFITRERKKPKLEDDIEREFQRVKKKWNKAFKSKKGKPHPAGRFGRGRIEYIIKKYGKAEALRRIAEAERYASGIAYSRNIEKLAMFVKLAGTRYKSPDLIQLATDIEENAYSIREEWIVPAYDKLYELNKGISPKTIAKQTRDILHL